MDKKRQNAIEIFNKAAATLTNARANTDIWNPNYDDDLDILEVRVLVCMSYGIDNVDYVLQSKGRKIPQSFRNYWNLIQ